MLERRGVMDMLLLPDYMMESAGVVVEGGVDTWSVDTRPLLGKRKHCAAYAIHDESPPPSTLAKITKINNGDQNSWEQVEELAADLDGSCSLSSLNVDLASTAFQTSDALLSLPSLTALKQEIFSPFNSNETSGEPNGGGGAGAGAGGGAGAGAGAGGQTSPVHRHNKHNIYHCYDQGMNGNAEYKVGLNSPGHSDGGSNSGSNLIVTTAPATSTVPHHTEDCRFQYVLAAATSIATKVNEETLTYLNQGQSYEIKLKKLGDLSEYRGKILKSVVRLVFHERRLQYMEREQLAAWEASHPGDSILEVDLPLSYGLFQLSQHSSHLNTIEFLWDPTKEVGVYIKVNCISTEFTPKKHGGEKGVPFRIQVETYLQTDLGVRHLHTASCQVKVFKLKGADRKHKQDREKIHKRPPLEQEKYQCSYECTILTDVPINGDNAFPPLLLSGSNSPTVSSSDITKLRQTLPVVKKEETSSPLPHQSSNLNSTSSEVSLQSVSVSGVCAGWSAEEAGVWLERNRYEAHVATLASYSGADLLRLSRDNLVQLCGLPDGIRLYNALHARAIAPRLTVYLCSADGQQKVYQAIFLSTLTSSELIAKLAIILDIQPVNISGLYMEGPNGIRVVVSDELVSHIGDQSTFTVEITARDGGNSASASATTSSSSRSSYQLLLKQTYLQQAS